jgi:hypothetical protein
MLNTAATFHLYIVADDQNNKVVQDHAWSHVQATARSVQTSYAATTSQLLTTKHFDHHSTTSGYKYRETSTAA